MAEMKAPGKGNRGAALTKSPAQASMSGQGQAGEGRRNGFGPNALIALQQTYGNQAAQRYAKRLAGGSEAGKTQPGPGSGGAVQMKEALMSSMMGAHMRAFTEDNDPADSTGNTKLYKVKEQQTVGKKISYRTKFEDKEKQDETGKWEMIEHNGVTGFVRKEKVKETATLANMRGKLSANKASTGQVGGTADPHKAEGFDEAAEQTGDAIGYTDDTLGDTSDELGELGKKEKNDKLEADSDKIGVAGSVTGLLSGGLGGLMAMKKGVSAFRSTTMTTGEKAGAIGEAGAEGVESVHKTFDGVANMVDSSAKVAGHSDGIGASDAVAGWSGSVGDAIGAIKSAFFTVKDIYTMFKEAFSTEGITLDEVVEGSLSAISHALQAAKSVVKTVKSILDILKIGTSALGTAIPAIGIAISGIEITLKVYGMIKSSINHYRMTNIKRDFKKKYAASSFIKEERKLQVRGKTLWSGNTGVHKDKLDDRKNALSGSAARTDDEQQELNDIREYELAKEMKNINNKRLIRAGMQIGFEMVNIAGEIATLSGVGAKVGLPLKAVAAGAGVSMSIARKVKQLGRDRAAKPGAWSVTKAVFNAEKSSEKKHAKRAQDADVIMNMIAELPEFDNSEEVKKQYEHIEHFITASGCNPKSLYRLNGDPSAQRNLLIEGMKKRP
ncbi:hypothetical protein [Paenibacillus sp. MBLB4367]|uniref:hypothetical protein n=1 Tax=Paenibacillus sp. MBLB4367 TaxID=3384767 RepID=UPI003908007B